MAIYAFDALVRRAGSLQKTPDAEAAGLLHINSTQAEKNGVREGYTVTVQQGGASAVTDVCIDERVADGCVRIQAGTAASAKLGAAIGPVSLERV